MELETLLLFLPHLDSARVYWMSGVWGGKRSSERMNVKKGLVEEARLGQHKRKTTSVGTETGSLHPCMESKEAFSMPAATVMEFSVPFLGHWPPSLPHCHNPIHTRAVGKPKVPTFPIDVLGWLGPVGWCIDGFHAISTPKSLAVSWQVPAHMFWMLVADNAFKRLEKYLEMSYDACIVYH